MSMRPGKEVLELEHYPPSWFCGVVIVYFDIAHVQREAYALN